MSLSHNQSGSYLYHGSMSLPPPCPANADTSLEPPTSFAHVLFVSFPPHQPLSLPISSAPGISPASRPSPPVTGGLGPIVACGSPPVPCPLSLFHVSSLACHSSLFPCILCLVSSSRSSLFPSYLGAVQHSSLTWWFSGSTPPGR